MTSDIGHRVPGTGPASRVVAVANGTYAHLRSLERAVPDTTDLVRLLENVHGFKGVLIDDRVRGALLTEIDTSLGDNSLVGGALVLLWTGHGEPGAKGKLRLMGRSNDTADGEVATPELLGEWAARTGATQVLVIVDTCYSGSGLTSALDMADAVISGRLDPTAAWFGVVASSRTDETAASGALARELKRLLSEGPRDEKLRLRWSAYDARVRGDDVIDALVKEWQEPRQNPQQASTGNAWPMLANPLYRPNAQHRVVEHLLQAARGTSTDATFFTGRAAVLERIVAWMRRVSPGVCVVTGPAGTGKSAIVGRIVSLADPDERARLLAVEVLVPALDPGEASVSAHLHCRGLDTKGTIEGLAGQLNQKIDAGIYDLLAHASRRRLAGAPLVLVLDGLDEAGYAECRDVALEVVQLLAKEALVLIATREVPGGVGQPGLLSLLGTSAETIDLGAQVEETLVDVRQYIVRRLAGVSPTMSPEEVADEIVQSARGQEPANDGPFLLARLVTSQLRAEPVDTRIEGWKAGLATSVVAALDHDLDRTVLVVGGREHPTAARELLRALSCAYGSGIPAGDVWPVVATAISPSGTTYSREDVYTLLMTLGRHVVAGAEGDQGVYRVAHQRLIDHLRPTLSADFERRLHPETAKPLAAAIADLYESLLRQGQAPAQHTYLWRHAWRHLADAGPEGIERLRGFVARDRKAFLPDLALALARVGSGSWLRGSPQDAVSLHQESVEIRQEIGGPLDLAMALFNLSFALSSAGNLAGADQAASEAADVARSVSDDPTARRVLASTLTAHGITEFRRGNLRAAGRLAQEAIGLFENEVIAHPEIAPALAPALYTAAHSAHALGFAQQADQYSRRALALLDERPDDSPAYQAILVDALSVRALVEFGAMLNEVTLLSSGQPAPASPGNRPSLEAAARIVALHRKRGATRTIADIATAEGMRLLAITTFFAQWLGRTRPDAPDPVALLDEAIPLVSPLTTGNVDAIVALASLRLARVRLTAGLDKLRALKDLQEVEAQLRVCAKTMDAAVALGQVLDLQVMLNLPAGVSEPALIDQQREAVDLLSQSPHRFVRAMLPEVLGRLIALLEGSGRKAEVVAARQRFVDVCRELHDGSEASAIRLAAALSDLAGGMAGQIRPIEALDCTTEALAVLEPFGASSPAVQLLRGAAELNRGALLMQVGSTSDARPALERALKLLDVDSTNPVVVGCVGTTLYNLSTLHLAAGEHDLALERSRRALKLLQEPGATGVATIISLARINLARALRACGFEAEGSSSLRDGIAELRTQMTAKNGEIGNLAFALDGAGAAMWDEVLNYLEDMPLLVRDLQVLRTRPLEQLGESVHVIRAGLEEAAGDPVRIRFLRSVARRERARDAGRFDALWKEGAGEVPDWLPIDPMVDQLLVAWWNTPTWQRSSAFLTAHPILLDPATDILIAEIRDAGGDHDFAAVRLGVLADARAQGIEQAYAPLLANQLLVEWLATDYATEFLTDRLDELVAAPVTAVLAAARSEGNPLAGVPLAILALTRRGEQSTAYRIRRESAFGLRLLQQALESTDADRLEALATLCLTHDLDAAAHLLAENALEKARAV